MLLMIVRDAHIVLVTFGFGEMVRIFFLNVATFGGPAGFAGIPAHTSLPFVFGVLLVLIYFFARLSRSRMGRAFRALQTMRWWLRRWGWTPPTPSFRPLAPPVVQEIFKQIPALRQEGVTILLVEQNARKALQCADHAYVLEAGQIALAGRADELLTRPEVQHACLGAS